MFPPALALFCLPFVAPACFFFSIYKPWIDAIRKDQ